MHFSSKQALFLISLQSDPQIDGAVVVNLLDNCLLVILGIMGANLFLVL